MPYVASNQGTPPKYRGGGPDEGHPSPYAQEFETSGGAPDDRTPRREWRNSGWGKGNNSSMGVTGTTG